jgi:hypothetical protein
LKKASNIILGLVMAFGIFGLLIMPKLVVQAEDVTVNATVSDSISFAISAVGSAQAVNGATTTVATSTGSAVPFGAITADANAIAAHDLTVTTNATTGYTVKIQYTAKPTKGSDNIDDLATHTNASPGSFSAAGVEAFGYTTNDATLSGEDPAPARFSSNKWAMFTVSPLEVAYASAPVAAEVTRVGYQMGVAPSTVVGEYTTTVTYTASTNLP